MIIQINSIVEVRFRNEEFIEIVNQSVFMHSIFFALFCSAGFNVGCRFLSHDSGAEFKHIKGKADEGLLRYSVNFRGKKKELGQLVPDHGHINSECC